MGTVPIGTGTLHDGLADTRNVAAGGEIHHGVAAVLDGIAQLLELLLDVGGGGGVADVGVDLACRGHADTHRLQVGVMDIGRDDHPAARYLVADGLSGEALAARYVLHLLGRTPLAGIVHLRANAVAGAPRHPLVSHIKIIIPVYTRP